MHRDNVIRSVGAWADTVLGEAERRVDWRRELLGQGETPSIILWVSFPRVRLSRACLGK
jgi:hypothetical protein